MGEMVIFKDSFNGKTAIIFKEDGTTVEERAFNCETCHKPYPESQLFTKWLSDDDAYIECEACR